MNRRLFFHIALTFSLLSCFTGCKKNKDEIPIGNDTIADPVQEFDAASLDFYNKGRLQWRLNADYMSKPLSDTGSITVIPVNLLLFDSVGSVKSRVIADSGIIANNMNSYDIWGNVYIRTRGDSMTVRTERLKWFKERRKVESDTFVQIETKNGDILRGKGLDAAEDFSRFKFKAQVEGYFPDFEKRLENNDDKIF